MQEMTKTAPAFQFYASDTMADKRYRSMSLEERGLLISILCECWVNRSLPSDTQSISKWLSFTKDAIEAALTERVLSFFKIDRGEITSPELERYRTELEERREKMSQGGKKGAKGKWNPSNDNSHPTNPLDRVSIGSRVEKSRDEKNSREESRREEKQYYRKDKEDVSNDSDQWVADYEALEKSSDRGEEIPF
jgi:hypothetical protein